MKIVGIVFIVLGVISTLGAVIGAVDGRSTSFSGITLAVLGAFILSRANKKKELEKEKERKRKWAEGN